MTALSLGGHTVIGFADPLAAWDALDTSRGVEVLITRIYFAPGKSNGVSLARMARLKRPGIQVLFVARPENAHHAEGIGTFLPLPAAVAEVIEVVERLLTPGHPD
jgi:hypothetical protein